MQIAFVARHENEGDSVLVLLSLLLTLLSLISSITLFISRLITVTAKYSQHVRQITDYEVKLTMKCVEFRKYHSFINDILRDEIIKALRNSDNSDLWNDRNDVSLSSDVYFIQNNIASDNTIIVYFSLILTSYMPDKNRGISVASNLAKSILEIGNNKSKLQNDFINSVVTRIKLGRNKRKKLLILDLKIFKNETWFESERIVNINSSDNGKGNGKGKRGKLEKMDTDILAQVLEMDGMEMQRVDPPNTAHTNGSHTSGEGDTPIGKAMGVTYGNQYGDTVSNQTVGSHNGINAVEKMFDQQPNIAKSKKGDDDIDDSVQVEGKQKQGDKEIVYGEYLDDNNGQDGEKIKHGEKSLFFG